MYPSCSPVVVLAGWIPTSLWGLLRIADLARRAVLKQAKKENAGLGLDGKPKKLTLDLKSLNRLHVSNRSGTFSLPSFLRAVWQPT